MTIYDPPFAAGPPLGAPTSLARRYFTRQVGAAFEGETYGQTAELALPIIWNRAEEGTGPGVDLTVERDPADRDADSVTVRLTVEDVRALRDHLDALLGERRATIPF